MTRWARAIQRAAAWACLTFVATLRDARTPWQSVESSPLPPEEGTREGKLRVRVREVSGRDVALASVRVWVMRDDGAQLAGAARTDAAGVAALEGLPVGEAWVLAEAPGFARASTQTVLAVDEHEASLTLTAGEVLRVTLHDDGGAPIAGAVISVRSADPLPYLARTNVEGEATFARLGPPPWKVTASAEGFEAASAAVARAEPAALSMTSRRLGALLVSTVDERGALIANATVAMAGSGIWPARRILSDATGHATIASVPRGIYDLRATRGDLVSPTAMGLMVGRGESKPVILVLATGRRASLRVVDAESVNQPVSGAAVVVAEGGLSSFPLETTTDSAGMAQVGPLARGDAFAAVSAAGFVAKSGLRVSDPVAGLITVALSRGATLSGEVLDARGFPVGGATIEVVGTGDDGEPIDDTRDRQSFRAAHFAWALTGPHELRPAGGLGVMPGPLPAIPHVGGGSPPSNGVGDPWVTRSDGGFRVFPVTPGRVRAIVRHPAYVEASSEFVRLAASSPATVRVVLHAGGSLEGRVVDERGAPVNGARIDLLPTRAALARTTFSASDGTFAFAAVPPELVLSLSRPDALGDVALRTNMLVNEDERKHVELVLPSSREPVTVRVTDEHGDALDGVEVRIFSLASDAPLQRTLFTHKEGAVVFSDARGLPIRVTAALRGRAAAVQTFTAAPAELALTLEAGLEVTGSVTARGGREAVAGAEVTLHVAGVDQSARTDKDGTFRMLDVPAGAALVTVVRDGYVTTEHRASIERPSRSDRAVTLGPIDLAEGGAVAGDVVDEHGDPVPGARVACGAARTLLPGGRTTPGVTLTNRRGEFNLSNLPEGDTTLEASAPQAGQGRVAVSIASGRTTERVRIVLSRARENESAPPAEPVRE